LKLRRALNDIFQAKKENNCQTTIMQSPLIIQGEIKTSQNKQKLRQFITTKPELQKILKRILYIEEVDK
jgi:hypothetical protein